MLHKSARYSDSMICSVFSVFDLLDDDLDGYIDSKELGTAMRACGLLPNERNVEILIREYDPKGSGVIDLGSFFIIMARGWRDKGEKDFTTRAAIRQLLFEKLVSDDKERRFMTAQTLRNVATDVTGEPITEDEVASLIGNIPDVFRTTLEGQYDGNAVEDFIMDFDERVKSRELYEKEYLYNQAVEKRKAKEKKEKDQT